MEGKNMLDSKQYKISRYIILLITMICCASFIPSNFIFAQEFSYNDYKTLLDAYVTNQIDYNEYLLEFNNHKPNIEYVIEAASYSRVDGMEVSNYEDFEGMEGISVYTEDSGLIEYEVDISEEGFYDISILYYPVEGKNASIQRAFFIDGKLPYSELMMVEFSRIWTNQVDVWERDNKGNDLKPKQIEEPNWIKSYLYDSEGYETEKLSVYLTKGIHKITIYSRREPMMLNKIILSNSEETKSYKEQKSLWDNNGANDSKDKSIRIEAEAAVRKSSQMLYPTQDKSSTAVYPYSAKELRNNIVGGNSSWRLVGQWLEWDFEIEETGYYNITLHENQNFVRGIYTSRKITIDGEVPFKEMKDYGFVYKSNWNMSSLKNDEGAYKFYLEKGKHTLRMEVVLGEFSQIVSEVQKIVVDLNSIYRKVIRITGVKPDEYRDYNLMKNIPELSTELRGIHKRLDDVIVELRNVAGGSSNREATLITMRDQLEYLIKDTERFTKIVGDYKTNTSALGTWIIESQAQPLALDTIYIHSPNVAIKQENNSWIKKIIHVLKTLYYSFVIDYNSIGNVSEDTKDAETITVWIGSGRDQANVIKALVDETFTKEKNINVNIMLVDMGTLLQATLAGQGPDVALQVGNDLPMNYGMRNAVVDLTQFDDLDEVTSMFRDSAMVPFQFEGKTFGLPETESYLMMFYRKDILKELELEIPQTWDEMQVALSVLSKNQMDLGMIPTTEQIFAMLLYQNGGEYYANDGKESALNSDISINTFKKYCEYYTDYKLDKDTSVQQRFRTGEAPIIIADYTFYNELQVSAPDIKGLWGFTMVPGTVRDDGSIDHTVSSSGVSSVIMESSNNKDAAWEFMKWWLGVETQTKYGREMEALMGAAARYPTANLEAFRQLPWPTEDFEALDQQAQWLKGIPQVPGGYFTWRNVNNAFYKVVIAEDKHKMQPREALTDYIRYINDEITFKRIEFNLPVN